MGAVCDGQTVLADAQCADGLNRGRDIQRWPLPSYLHPTNRAQAERG
jgi:hypothetical protein